MEEATAAYIHVIREGEGNASMHGIAGQNAPVIGIVAPFHSCTLRAGRGPRECA